MTAFLKTYFYPPDNEGDRSCAYLAVDDIALISNSDEYAGWAEVYVRPFEGTGDDAFWVEGDASEIAALLGGVIVMPPTAMEGTPQ